MSSLLSAIGFAAGVVALVIYVLVLARRPQWVRLLNGSGLFFTGLALLPTPTLLGFASVHRSASFSAQAAVIFTILAAVVQSAAALRNRRSWDGVDRRSPGHMEARS